jgi:hypothetical protein
LTQTSLRSGPMLEINCPFQTRHWPLPFPNPTPFFIPKGHTCNRIFNNEDAIGSWKPSTFGTFTTLLPLLHYLLCPSPPPLVYISPLYFLFFLLLSLFFCNFPLPLFSFSNPPFHKKGIIYKGKGNCFPRTGDLPWPLMCKLKPNSTVLLKETLIKFHHSFSLFQCLFIIQSKLDVVSVP